MSEKEPPLDPPEKPELTEATRRAAEHGFDAGDALALDWLSDHQSDAEVRAFTEAAARYLGSGACFLTTSAELSRLFETYAALRDAFVDACAEEYG